MVTTSVSGDIGSGVVPGSGRSITWNAGVDFSDQEVSNMKVRLRAVDAYSNLGSFVSSANFVVDTKAPVVSSVVASQLASSSTVNITYTLADTNNSSVYIEISEDNGSTWVVATTTLTGAVGADVTPGSKTVTWNAAIDFASHQQSDMVVRVRAVDVYNNVSGNVDSSAFSVDTSPPGINTVVAAQTLGTQNISITYNLVDANNATVAFDVSDDGGSTWNVTHSSVTGDVGVGIVPSSGKTITWNVGADYPSHQNSNMMVRVRGTDTFNNTSANVNSATFGLDTLAPAINVVADLQSQPNAGDTTVLVGGSFTEANPNINNFFVAINGGVYGPTTTGEGDAASPANQATNVGISLTGNDYISKVKIVHTDDYGQSATNQNTSPNTAYKFVKPYIPDTPTVNNPQNTSIDLLINAHVGESTSVEYAILEVSTNKYVQTNGTLDNSAVWKTLGTGVGQWGNVSGIAGKVTINGLVSPVANYSFKVKSRNPSDVSYSASSESDFSNIVGISNTAPSITISSANQVDGANYVVINYTGTDGQNDTNNLSVYEFSTNTINWHTMTEKGGVGSNGTSSLVFTSTGISRVFTWDVAVDLPNSENPITYVRLQSTDTLLSSNLAVSSAFAVDTYGPVVANFVISQTPSTNNVVINYDLVDNAGSNNTVILQISNDSGSSWGVPTTTASGNVGGGVSSGVGKSISWNAGIDFNNQENSSMRVRIMGVDRFSNIGSFASSNSFTVDTKAPAVSAVSAAQTVGGAGVIINYTLNDLTASGSFVEVEISSDNGISWTVPTSTLSGNVGSGQSVGSKSITWDAKVDFGNQEQSDMKVRVRAQDYFSNQGAFVQSAVFDLDTKSPVINNVVAAQTIGTRNIIINYDLSDSATTSTVFLEISDDGGATWVVATTSVAGDIGDTTSDINKTITWNAGVDFVDQEKNNMRVRLHGLDVFGNLGSDYSSSDFALDTKAPVGLLVFSKFSSTTSTVTLNWSSGIVDTNFDHYEIWHGSNEFDVQNRAGTASKWSTADDVNLSNINTIFSVITGLSITNNYYVKIWAVDSFGNESTINNINVYETESVVPPVFVITSGGGGGLLAENILLPTTPILTAFNAPVNTPAVVVSGIASPRSRIDLYDNGLLLGRFISVVDNESVFSQKFTFSEGNHLLSVRAVDFNNNVSQFSNTVSLTIDLTAPTIPYAVLPAAGEVLTTATPILHGLAEPNSIVQVSIDGNNLQAVVSDDGVWSITLPSSLALSRGPHTAVLWAIDNSDNQSVDNTINFSVAVPSVVVSPTTAPTAGEIITTPLIPGLIEATEIPSLLPPQVTAVATGVETIIGNSITFQGTALPNQEIVAYINSERTVIYRTLSDSSGVWKFNHSQDTIELQPGTHSIYAVSIDPKSKVKTSLGPIRTFVVNKSFWVNFYQHLNLPMTIVAIVALLLAILFLYRIKQKEVVTA